MAKIKTTYKDGVFRKLFNNEEKIRELYGALSGSLPSSDSDVKIVTLDNAIFGEVKNDLAFIIDDKFIVLTEHQSTINPNMPFRMGIYLMKEYEQLFYTNEIYGTRLVKIPTPELYVFYNGNADQPVTGQLKFSDAFAEKYAKLSIEIIIDVINVNEDKGAEILKRCRTLREYSQFIAIAKRNIRNGMEARDAIKAAVRECIENDILKDFLLENGGEVVSAFYKELTRAEIEEIRRRDGFAEGHRAGFEDGNNAGKLEIAQNMKRSGMANDTIAELTGLSIEQIEQL